MKKDLGSITRSKWWLYLVLVLILFGCLWTGWRDFDPMMPQAEVRENIRLSIRWIIQAFVQYLIPAAILVFLVNEARTNVRSRQGKS